MWRLLDFRQFQGILSDENQCQSGYTIVAYIIIPHSSGIFVRDIEVELYFLIWNVDNHSVSAFYAYMHSCGLQECKVISIWVQLPSFFRTSTLGHIAGIGLEWVLGWIRHGNMVFAPTGRVRVLDQLWYLSTSKTILTILKLLLQQKLVIFVSKYCVVIEVSVFRGRFTQTLYLNLFFHIRHSPLQDVGNSGKNFYTCTVG